MRYVQYYEYKKVEGQSHYDKCLQGEAMFHQWGVDYEEFETGPGNYSTAIIELPNGTVKNVPADMINFIKPLNFENATDGLEYGVKSFGAISLSSVDDENQEAVPPIKMPLEITAENGAKGLLIGEFYESIQMDCPDCDRNDIAEKLICPTCKNEGMINKRVPVSWTTIKGIYRRIVQQYS